MPKLVPISGKKILKILIKNNFEIIRINGGHHFLINKNTNKTTTVPVHGNEDIGPGLLRQILRDIEITVDEYEEMRKK